MAGTGGLAGSELNVLPVRNRLRRPDEFTTVVRHGRRAGRQTLVVHVIAGGDVLGVPVDRSTDTEPPRAGFIVSKAVGDAVTRNRVKRRLRHLIACRLPRFPHGTRLVVRALPAAATATFGELADELDRAVSRALRTDRRTTGHRSSRS